MTIFWSCNSDDSNAQIPPPPPELQIIDIVEAHSQLTVVWNALEGCENYEVWLDGEKHSETPETLKRITGLTNGQEYYVRIRATINGRLIVSNRESGVPHEPIGPLPPPEEVKIKDDDRSFIVTWNPVKGATSYQVFVNNTLFAEVFEPKAEVDGLENGVSYPVQIISKNSAETSEKSGAVSGKPDPYIRKAKIGMGFNLFGSLNTSSISLRPILNLDRLNQDNEYIIEDETRSAWSVSTADTIKQVNVRQNQSISMGASVPFKDILLSAGASAGYSRGSTTETQTHYALIRAEHFIKTVALTPMLYDPDGLRRYYTDGFLKALENETPRELFAHYGHALLLKYRLGGNQEIYVTHFNSKQETLSQFRTAVNAAVTVLGINIGASVKSETSSSTSTSEWRSNSDIYVSRSGGELSKALSLEGAFAEYPSWVDSIEKTPDFAGVESYLNSYIPLWEIAKYLGKHTLAHSLKEEFVRQAMKRVDDLETIWPGEWFSFDEKVYRPGAAVFIHPQQFVTDEDGDKYPAMVNYLFYVAGAGAGGRGNSWWGVSGRLNGGAGGGGALMKIGVKSDKGITASIIAGAGGSGGLWMSGHRWDGGGYSPGGDSQVTLYGQTFTAGGGQNSGFSDDRYYPAPGGTGSPSYPPDFVSEYEIADGGKSTGEWTPPGSGGTIDNLKAGSGGKGGIRESVIGDTGEDGWVRVRWYYYDGE
jgi:hypothetical protein